jgi:hypothetical protein
LWKPLADNASASSRTFLLPASTICCGQKKNGSTITQSVEISRVAATSCKLPGTAP